MKSKAKKSITITLSNRDVRDLLSLVDPQEGCVVYPVVARLAEQVRKVKEIQVCEHCHEPSSGPRPNPGQRENPNYLWFFDGDEPDGWFHDPCHRAVKLIRNRRKK